MLERVFDNVWYGEPEPCGGVCTNVGRRRVPEATVRPVVGPAAVPEKEDRIKSTALRAGAAHPKMCTLYDGSQHSYQIQLVLERANQVSRLRLAIAGLIQALTGTEEP
jgi:hypothetical protein